MYNDIEKFKCKSCSKEERFERVNIERFISKIDSLFMTNNLNEVKKCIEYWKKEAKSLNDDCGLLSILNEEIGFARRIDDKEIAFKAIDEAKELLNKNDRNKRPSGAVIITNIATTLNCFDKYDDSIKMYEIADDIYKEYNLEKTYEYAAMLNNKSTALSNMERYTEAEECINKAINILKEEGKHDSEIAVSLVNLAHLLYDRDGDSSVRRVESVLDLAWDYLNSDSEKHDANYAYVLAKCAPSFKYFNREMEAEVLKEISDEIYGGTK